MDLEKPTALLDQGLRGCTQRECKFNKDLMELLKTWSGNVDANIIYLYDHPPADKEVVGGPGTPDWTPAGHRDTDGRRDGRTEEHLS